MIIVDKNITVPSGVLMTIVAHPVQMQSNTNNSLNSFIFRIVFEYDISNTIFVDYKAMIKLLTLSEV